MAWLCASEKHALASIKSLVVFRWETPRHSHCCRPARRRLLSWLRRAFKLSPGQHWVLEEKYKIILVGFLFATLFLHYVSQRSDGQSWKSHLLASPCLISCKSWGQSPWNRQDNLVFRKPKCESRFIHISINLLFKGIENSFVHRLKQSNYCSPQLKGRSGNGCWLFLFHSSAFVNDCWEQLD